MNTTGRLPEASMDHASPFPFLRLIERLKDMPRAGWLLRGIDHPESVSDHMYRMAIMVMMVPEIPSHVQTKALKLALVHDLGEAITGDITPADGIPKEVKRVREELAFEFLSILIRPVSEPFANEIRQLWEEYEEGTTEAARLVRSIDALECMDQAVIYERRLHRSKNLGDFMTLQSKLQHGVINRWNDVLQQDRNSFWENGDHTNFTVVFVVGGPGSGKGTQCQQLAVEFGCKHLSVGDILRAEASSADSPFAGFINRSIENSVIIPAELTMHLIEKRSSEYHGTTPAIILLDGFPRSMEQILAFEEKFQQQHYTLCLECPDETLCSRLAGRSQHSGRSDDHVLLIKKRLETWTHDKGLVLSHLRKTTELVEIDATGPVHEVYAKIKTAYQRIANALKPGKTDSRNVSSE